VPKQWTDEERKAFGEKMKAARATKTNTPQTKTTPTQKIEIPEDKLQVLMERIAALEAEKATRPTAPTQEPTISQSGHVQGIKEKYTINKAAYQHVDPRERLFKEPKLARFAPEENYTMYWRVENTRYQNAQLLWIAEPRFELEVRRKVLDDDGSVKGEYQVGKLVCHEDWDAAVDIANSLGLEIDPQMGPAFIDEMRYQTFRMFVEELFFQPKTIQQVNGGKKEMVVAGTVVTFYENPKDLAKDL
jgi:hypothetical protein